MLAWHIEDSVGAHTFQALLERVELISFESWLSSPVCRMNSGAAGSALIPMAARRVAVTSGFAALLKPICKSLIYANVKSSFSIAPWHASASSNANDLSTALHYADSSCPRPRHSFQKSAAFKFCLIMLPACRPLLFKPSLLTSPV